MHARRVSRSARRVNRDKSEREPPIAVLGNITAPTTSIGLTERNFKRSYLPMAIANHWISSTPGSIQLVNVSIDNPRTMAPYTLPYDDVVALYLRVRDGTSGSDAEIDITYKNGFNLHNSYGDNDTSNDAYYIWVSPLQFIIYDSTGEKTFKSFNYDEAQNSFIDRIYIGGGGSSVEGTLLVTRLIFTPGGLDADTTVRSGRNYYPLK